MAFGSLKTPPANSGRRFNSVPSPDQSSRQRGRAGPDVLHVGGRVPLEEGPHVNVLLPLGDTVRKVAEGVRGDVDAARRQPVALLSDEGPVVTDDVLDRIRHDPTPPGRGRAPVMLGAAPAVATRYQRRSSSPGRRRRGAVSTGGPSLTFSAPRNRQDEDGQLSRL